MRPIIIGDEKFMRILVKGSFFFNNLGYENSEDEELTCLGIKIYKSQQNLINFIVNNVRKTPLNDALVKIFTFFYSKKFR